MAILCGMVISLLPTNRYDRKLEHRKVCHSRSDNIFLFASSICLDPMITTFLGSI